MAFHEIRFPIDIALGSKGGPERRVEVVELGSGREERNARWAHAKRRFNAGYGVKTATQLQQTVQFFEERRGKLHGFRFRDPLDNQSSLPGAAVSASDQLIGTGTGAQSSFQLVKTYGASFAPYARTITKPVIGSVAVSVNGVAAAPSDFSVDHATGIVTFIPAKIPAAGAAVRAGFAFDVPVRFDTDYLEVDLSAFAAGEIPSIPLVEIIP
jgi:uncharacterized protein (TIGR02217 family)